MRLGADPGADTRLPGGAGRPAAAGVAPPADFDIVVHVQGVGDRSGKIGDWAGTRGSRQWIEGFSITPRDGVKPEDIEYQAVLGRGWLSPWIEGGKFCGSRGMALPLLGLKVRLKGNAAKTHECSCSATFVDGSAVGPIPGGETCEAESLAALEAFQLVIHRSGGAAAPAGHAGGGNAAGGGQAARPSGRTAIPLSPDGLPAPFASLRSRREHSVGPRELSWARDWHIVRHLVASKQHDVVFITSRTATHCRRAEGTVCQARPRRRGAYRGTRTRWRGTARRGRGTYGRQSEATRLRAGHHHRPSRLGRAAQHPRCVARRAVARLSGILLLHRWHRCRVRSGVPDASADHPRIRAKNAINLLALNLGAHAQTPTKWQLSTYPDWARHCITLLPEGVNLDVCKPNAQARRRNLTIGGTAIRPNDKLVTYVARDLEPYRGFHVMMRAVPHLLRARKDVRVVLVGADGISYGAPPAEGTWRQKMLEELGDSIDPTRVLFPGRLEYTAYVAMLQRSDAHVYLSYPFVASWSLREALASGCVVVGSDTPTVSEFVTHEQNGLLVPFFDPKGLADAVLRVLEDAPLARRLREGARRYAEKDLAMADYIAAYEALIARLTQR